MKKKIIGIVMAAVLTCAMGMTAFAAPSPTVTGVVKAGSGTDANGNAVTATISEVSAEFAAAVANVKNVETLKALLGADFVEGMTVADVKEVSVPAGTPMPVTLSFGIAGVTASSKVAVLHYNATAGAWEKVSATAGAGTITATFTSLSPVAFVVDKAAGVTTTTGTKSPSTGESSIVIVLGAVAMLAAGSAFGLTRKKRA